MGAIDENAVLSDLGRNQSNCYDRHVVMLSCKLVLKGAHSTSPFHLDLEFRLEHSDKSLSHSSDHFDQSLRLDALSVRSSRLGRCV